MRFTTGTVLAIMIAVALIIIILLVACIWHWDCYKQPANAQKITAFPATLGEGTHYIDSPLSWSGNGGAIIFDGVNNSSLFFINSGKVTLSGVGPTYNLDDPNQTYSGLRSAIYINNSHNITVNGGSILSDANANNNSLGVIILGSNDVTVDNSNFNNLAEGVAVINSSGVVVKNNTFVDIYGTALSGNVTNTGAAVSLENSSAASIENNDAYTTGRYSDSSLASTFVFAGAQSSNTVKINNNNAASVHRGFRAISGRQFVLQNNSLVVNVNDGDVIDDSGAVFTSAGATSVVIDGGLYKSTGGNTSPITIVDSPYTVRNTTVEAFGTFFSLIQAAGNGSISDNNLLGNQIAPGADGILIAPTDSTASGVSIKDNNIAINVTEDTPSGYVPAAIRLTGVNGGLVDSNNVVSSGDSSSAIGILLTDGSFNVTVSNNSIGSFGMGIQDDFGSNNKILNNNITGNGISTSGNCGIISGNNIGGGCVSIELTCDSSKNLVSNNQVTCAHPIDDDGQYNRLVNNNDGSCGCQGNDDDSKPSKFEKYPEQLKNKKVNKGGVKRGNIGGETVAIITAN